MAHGDAREGKWRGKMRMEWVASSLALYVGTRSIQSPSADPHSSTASSRLNWHPRRFKWTCPFRWKTKSGFCACAITFRTWYTECHNDCSMCNINSRIWMWRTVLVGRVPKEMLLGQYIVACSAVLVVSGKNSTTSVLFLTDMEREVELWQSCSI